MSKINHNTVEVSAYRAVCAIVDWMLEEKSIDEAQVAVTKNRLCRMAQDTLLTNYNELAVKRGWNSVEAFIFPSDLQNIGRNGRTAAQVERFYTSTVSYPSDSAPVQVAVNEPEREPKQEPEKELEPKQEEQEEGKYEDDISVAIESAGWSRGQANIVAMWSRKEGRTYPRARAAIEDWLRAHPGQTLTKPRPRPGQAAGQSKAESSPALREASNDAPIRVDALALEHAILTFLESPRGKSYTYNQVATGIEADWQQVSRCLRGLEARQSKSGVISLKPVTNKKTGKSAPELYMYAPERVQMTLEPDRAEDILDNLVFRLVKSAPSPPSRNALEHRTGELLGPPVRNATRGALDRLEAQRRIEVVKFRNWRCYRVI